MGDNNTQNIVKREVGRPTKITEDTIAKLEAVFKLGVTDEVACDYADIHPATFYRHINQDENFARRIRQAKMYGRLAAGNVIMDAIVKQKDVDTAKWWLEKKYPDEFGSRPQFLQQINIKDKPKVVFVSYDENHSPQSSNGGGASSPQV